MKNDYLDNVLIKLKRKYSQNEVVSALTKKLSEAEKEIGFLKSEKAELEYNLSQHKKELKKQLTRELTVKISKRFQHNMTKKDKLISTLRGNISELITELNKYKK